MPTLILKPRMLWKVELGFLSKRDRVYIYMSTSEPMAFFLRTRRQHEHFIGGTLNARMAGHMYRSTLVTEFEDEYPIPAEDEYILHFPNHTAEPIALHYEIDVERRRKRRRRRSG